MFFSLPMLSYNTIVLVTVFRTSSGKRFIPGNRIAAINTMRSSWHLGAAATTSMVLLPLFVARSGCIFSSASLLGWPQTRDPPASASFSKSYQCAPPQLAEDSLRIAGVPGYRQAGFFLVIFSGWTHDLANVNSAVMNIDVLVSL
ncbi:hypothetical protein STEG23_035292 [Scotinomys teguina]